MAAPRQWANNHHFKSFGRTALIRDVDIHNIVSKSGRRTLSDFGDFETINNGASDRVAHHRIQINHYQCKPFPEFQARMRCGLAYVLIDRPEQRRADESLERFRQLDLNTECDRSIRRFDAAFDMSLNRNKEILDQDTKEPR